MEKTVADDICTPNWQNEEDYSFCDDLDGEGWAWEFLRRNPDYQDEYDQAFEQEKRDQRRLGKLKFPITSEIQHQLVYHPQRLEDESYKAWQERCRELLVTPRVLTLLQAVAKTWNLSAAVHPSEVTAAFDSPFDPTPAIDQLDSFFDIENGKRVVKDGYAPMVFRLDLPLKRQLEVAHVMLQAQILFELDEDFNVPNNPLQRDKWKNYVRLLDAEEEGASWQDMFTNIVPEDEQRRSKAHEPDHARKLVNDRLRSAKNMTQQYFLCLAQFPVKKL